MSFIKNVFIFIILLQGGELHLLVFLVLYILVSILLEHYIIKRQPNIDDISILMSILGLILFVLMLPYIMLKITFSLIRYVYID